MNKIETIDDHRIEVGGGEAEPGDDRRRQEPLERRPGNPNRDGELIGGEEAEHGGDGPLHRVLRRVGDALGDDAGIKRRDPAEHVGEGGELAPQRRLPR